MNEPGRVPSAGSVTRSMCSLQRVRPYALKRSLDQRSIRWPASTAFGESMLACHAIVGLWVVFVANVTGNCVAPGPIETPMVSKLHGPDERRLWMAQIPQARYGEPEEVAAAVAFLLSPEFRQRPHALGRWRLSIIRHCRLRVIRAMLARKRQFSLLQVLAGPKYSEAIIFGSATPNLNKPVSAASGKSCNAISLHRYLGRRSVDGQRLRGR